MVAPRSAERPERPRFESIGATRATRITQGARRRTEGHREGLKRFGTQAEFLLARIEKRPPPVIVSVSWEYGLMRVE